MIFFLPDYDCPWWFWLAGKVMSQRFLIVKDELLDNMEAIAGPVKFCQAIGTHLTGYPGYMQYFHDRAKRERYLSGRMV
jgi:hypothetical protein